MSRVKPANCKKWMETCFAADKDSCGGDEDCFEPKDERLCDCSNYGNGGL